jgi:hypothetical protein
LIDMPHPLPNAVLERYTVDEKLDLLARVWDSLLDTSGLPAMPEWHRQLLAERVEQADRDPKARIPLDEVRRELLGDKS